MHVPKPLLYFSAFIFMPIVYIFCKEYKRGVIMHILGIISMTLALAIFEIGFTVGNDTFSAILLGSAIVFLFYGIMVYDCILVIRKRELKQLV